MLHRLAIPCLLAFPLCVQAGCPVESPETAGAPTLLISTSEQLQKAITGLRAGGAKHLVLSPGEYRVLKHTYVIETPGVTIRGASGNRDDVIVRGSGMTGTTAHVFLVRAPDFTLRDLTLGWVSRHAVQLQGEHDPDRPKFYNLRFVDTGEQMLKVSSDEKHGADYGVVRDSLFEFRAGVASQYYTGGIDAHFAIGWRITGNTFRHIRSPSSSLAEHAIHFWRGSGHTLVERNVIYNSDRGIGFGLGKTDKGHTGGVIRNNFVHVSRDVGIGIESSAGANVSHNTVFVQGDYPNAIEYRYERTQEVIISHNLTNAEIRSRDGGGAELVSNVEFAQADWFANAAAGDLHLVKGTPNVRAAARVTLDTPTDIDCEPRDESTGVDIGADQTTLALDSALAVTPPGLWERYHQRWLGFSAALTDRLQHASPDLRVALTVAGVLCTLVLLQLLFSLWLWRQISRLRKQVKTLGKSKRSRKGSSGLPPTLR